MMEHEGGDDGRLVRTVQLEPQIWTSTTMSLDEKKSKFKQMEQKHQVNTFFVLRGVIIDVQVKPNSVNGTLNSTIGIFVLGSNRSKLNSEKS